MTSLTKTYSNRELAGEYKETSIDEAKKNNNRLVSICGKFRTVDLINGERITLTGKREWDKWSKNNTYVTDF